MAGAVTVAARAPVRAGMPPAGDAALAERALRIAYPVALGVLGDAAAADDVAQNVAITALRKRDALRDADRLDAWLYRISVRAALREARRNGSRRAAELAAASRSSHGGDADDAGEVIALLARLPSRQRAALTLRYVHDLGDAEIARALRCRTGTVRSLLSRGRAVLRESLSDRAGGDGHDRSA